MDTRNNNIVHLRNSYQRKAILLNFCAMEAASATRLSSENKGESSIRSPGLLLNSIKYCKLRINEIIFAQHIANHHLNGLKATFICLCIKNLPLWDLSFDLRFPAEHLHSEEYMWKKSKMCDCISSKIVINKEIWDTSSLSRKNKSQFLCVG